MNAKSVLDDFIVFATAKYGNSEATINAINGYLEGNLNYITRDNNFREKFSRLNRQEIWNIMGGGTVVFYVNKVLSNQLSPLSGARVPNQGITNNNQLHRNSSGTSIATYNMFMQSCYNTALISPRQLLLALKSAAMGNFSYMSNGEALSNAMSHLEVEGFCTIALRNAGYDVSQSVDIISDFANYVNSVQMSPNNPSYTGHSY